MSQDFYKMSLKRLYPYMKAGDPTATAIYMERIRAKRKGGPQTNPRPIHKYTRDLRNRGVRYGTWGDSFGNLDQEIPMDMAQQAFDIYAGYYPKRAAQDIKKSNKRQTRTMRYLKSPHLYDYPGVDTAGSPVPPSLQAMRDEREYRRQDAAARRARGKKVRGRKPSAQAPLLPPGRQALTPRPGRAAARIAPLNYTKVKRAAARRRSTARQARPGETLLLR